MRKGATAVYHWVALLIAAGAVVQFLLAGAGVFGAESFESHKALGWMLHTAAIIVVIAAIVGPRTQRAIVMSIAFFVVFTIQVDPPRRAGGLAVARGLPSRAGAGRARDGRSHRAAGDQPRTGSSRSSSSRLSSSCISAVISS